MSMSCGNSNASAVGNTTARRLVQSLALKHLSFIHFHSRFSLLVTVTAALGNLEIPNGFQQPLIAPLAPHKARSEM